MKKFDRILSYIAIFCALIMCFMLVSSAGSYVPESASTVKMVPYVPLESLDIYTVDESGTDVVYTLNLIDAFRTLQASTSNGGNETEVLLPLGTLDSDADVKYCTVQVSTLFSSSDTLNVTYTINYNQLPGSGTSDGTEIVFTSDEFTYDHRYNTNHYLPYFRFIGAGDSYSFPVEQNITAYTYYKPASGSASVSDTSSVNDATITGNNTFYDCFGLYGAYSTFNGRNSSTTFVTGSNKMHIKESTFSVSNDYGFTGFQITIPYVAEDFADDFYTSWINSFDLGTNNTVTQTIIQTSIVTSYIPGSPDGSYPDFSTFLVTAVRGFMDFGFFGISIAGILSAIVLFKLVRVFINFFAGG